MARLVVAFAFALAQSPCAHAQTPDLALRQEVDELKARVEAIEKRLGAPPNAAAANAPAAPSANPSDNWRRVRQGMTREQVKSLVGEPSKAFELDGSQVWYYRYEAGTAGSVFYDSAGRVTGLQRPAAASKW